MELTTSRLSYLFYLNRAAVEDCTVTKMAKMFSVSKSTVSRNLDYLAANGVMEKENMCLTDYGRQLAEQYAEEVQLFREWIGQNVPGGEREDQENAIRMAVSLSPEMKERMFVKIRLNRLFGYLDYRGTIRFSEFVHYLPDGEYPVAFVIHRENAKKEKHFSMADRGFVHPAALRIHGENGMICLQAVTMERRNILEGLIASGKLTELAYDAGKRFAPTVREGDLYQIPADALEYVFHREENMLIGSVRLEMYAPMENRKMHGRRALLSVILQKL